MKENVNPNEAVSATQKQRILAYMLAWNRITPMEALHRFGSFRLGARIAEIKEAGYDVKSQFVKVGPSHKQVKQYWI